MTWYNEDYRRRQIVGINAFGGSGTSADIDVEIPVPSDWDDFWDNIRSDFKDVVVTDSKGRLLNFQRKTGANYSTRTLTLQVYRLTISNDDAMNVAYIYFYNPDETTDSSTVITVSGPKTGYILLSAPHSRVVQTRNAQSALDAPIQSFVKGSGDEVHVFWIVGNTFAKRLSPYNERNDEEGIDFVKIANYDSSGTDASARYTESDTRLGNGFIRATYKAGDSGSDYAIAVEVNTTLGQVIENRAILRVIDLLP